MGYDALLVLILQSDLPYIIKFDTSIINNLQGHLSNPVKNADPSHSHYEHHIAYCLCQDPTTLIWHSTTKQ